MTWLLLNLIVTWYMVGLIWLIQVVHYPLFANIPTAAFPDYERQHTHRTAWVVIGPRTRADGLKTTMSGVPMLASVASNSAAT